MILKSRPMFRRWRVRHCYPQPVVDLVVSLLPAHGAAALSRLLDIPTSVIYRWRAKNRVGAAQPAGGASDAERLAALVARCAALGFRLDEASAVPRRAPERTPLAQTSASAGSPVSDATPPRRDVPDARREAEAPALRSRRYVFDAGKERSARGVRRRLEAVRQAVDTGYFADVDCPALAQMAQMSLHHFIRVFRDMVGMSPHRYLTRARVEAAKRLLRASSEPIDVIAVGVGFRSGASLNRAFKRIEGVSVSGYCQTVKHAAAPAVRRATASASNGASPVAG